MNNKFNNHFTLTIPTNVTIPLNSYNKVPDWISIWSRLDNSKSNNSFGINGNTTEVKTNKANNNSHTF